jgi:hypothetical protein
MTFTYHDFVVDIAKETHKGKTRYWFLVDNRPITFVSNPDTAKRLAIKFIEVIVDEQFMMTKQGVTANYLKN